MPRLIRPFLVVSPPSCPLPQVYHRDRYTADRLLGRGTVPLAALLEEPWLDGYVPMLASKPLRTQRGDPPTMERVAVGSLRLVLLIEELGPAVGPARVKRRSEAAIRPEVSLSTAEDLPWPEAEGGVELPEYAGSVYASDAEEKQDAGGGARANTPGGQSTEQARDQDADGEGEEELERNAFTSEIVDVTLGVRKEVHGGSGHGEENKIRAESGGGRYGVEGTQRKEGGALEQRAPQSISHPATPAEGRSQDRGVMGSGRAESGGAEAGAGGSRTDGAGRDAAQDGVHHGAGTPASIRGGAEYEAAWALEMWKRSEVSGARDGEIGADKYARRLVRSNKLENLYYSELCMLKSVPYRLKIVMLDGLSETNSCLIYLVKALLFGLHKGFPSLGASQHPLKYRGVYSIPRFSRVWWFDIDTS